MSIYFEYGYNATYITGQTSSSTEQRAVAIFFCEQITFVLFLEQTQLCPWYAVVVL